MQHLWYKTLSKASWSAHLEDKCPIGERTAKRGQITWVNMTYHHFLLKSTSISRRKCFSGNLVPKGALVSLANKSRIKTFLLKQGLYWAIELSRRRNGTKWTYATARNPSENTCHCIAFGFVRKTPMYFRTSLLGFGRQDRETADRRKDIDDNQGNQT